jgi:hypothetical protein
MPFYYTQAPQGGAWWYMIGQQTQTATTLTSPYCNTINPTVTANCTTTSTSAIWYQIPSATQWLGFTDQTQSQQHFNAIVQNMRDQQLLNLTRQDRRPAFNAPAIRRAREMNEHRGRRVLRRSMELYARVRGHDEIRRFVRGDPVILQGHRFRYRVTKKDDLVRNASAPVSMHIPYHLELLDPVNDNRVASGCLVIADTPMIDQVLALALNVQDPEGEQRVLARTNWDRVLPVWAARLEAA